MVNQNAIAGSLHIAQIDLLDPDGAEGIDEKY